MLQCVQKQKKTLNSQTHLERNEAGDSGTQLQTHHKATVAFPRGPVVKIPPANAGDTTGSSPVPERSHMPKVSSVCSSQPLEPTLESPGSEKKREAS